MIAVEFCKLFGIDYYDLDYEAYDELKMQHLEKYVELVYSLAEEYIESENHEFTESEEE